MDEELFEKLTDELDSFHVRWNRHTALMAAATMAPGHNPSADDVLRMADIFYRWMNEAE